MKVNAQELIDKAVKFLEGGINLDEAENIFHAILDSEPDNVYMLHYLSCLGIRKKRYGYVRQLLLRAVTHPKAFPGVWNNLGYACRELGLRDEAIKAFKKAIELQEKSGSGDPDIYANLASMYVQNGTPQRALELCNQALAIQSNHDAALNNKGLALLEMGRYTEGFPCYEAREITEKKQERNYAVDSTIPLWDGTPGKTVVVYGEQGIGDEIMFASVLPDMTKQCTVILDAHPRLADIFRKSFPNLIVYGTRKKSELEWPSLYQIDAKIPIGSLCQFFRKRPEDFPGHPYLIADQRYLPHVDRYLESSSRPKVGISWKGGTKKTNLNSRTIDLETLLPLLKLDVDFISLQYTKETAEEIARFEAKHGIKIHHYQHLIDDYDYTAALVSQLDLVISVPQSVVHLAGALGVPAWQLTPKKAMWQMGVYGQDMPWYHCVKNYWQGDDAKWEPVIKRVKEDLCSLLAKPIAA